MATFNEKLKSQTEVEKTILKVVANFKKEPLRNLKRVPRLKEWYDRLNQLWDEFRAAHEELGTFENDLITSDYFVNRHFENVQAKCETMKEKIEQLLKNLEPNEETINLDTSQTQNEIQSEQSSESNDEQDISEEEDENESEPGDTFKTPRARPPTTFKTPIKTPNFGVNTAFPNFVMRHANLKSKAEETVARYENKAKRFGKELDIIEQYIMDGLRTRAQLSTKDVEKLRRDLEEGIEELTFMLGKGAQQHEDNYNILVMRYRQILEEVGTREKSNDKKGVLKLKPIEIPKFSGALQDWPTFSGLFKTMVMDEPAYNDIERMQYLKTSIGGEAAKLISNMEITAANFGKAWTILTDRFENKRAIRDAHLEQLLELPAMTRESSSQLRNVYDKSKECIELLSEVSKEQILLYILIKKLPFETRKIYEQSRENPTKEQKLSEYFDFMHKRCQVLEAIEGNMKHSEKSEMKKSFQPFAKEKCALCNDANHAIYMCEKFKKMTTMERREIVKQKSLCLLCLKGNPKHVAADCKFKKMCPHCNKRHNGLLHMNEKQEKKPTQTVKHAHVATTEENIEDIVCATTLNEPRNTSGLLATALVRINVDNKWSETFRALIDQGSMASFICERAVKSLKLEKRKNEFTVTGIGDSSQSASGTVTIEIGARYPSSFKTKTTAIIMNKLTTMLPTNNINREQINFNLNELILADPSFDKSEKIDMILGVDVYYDIILPGLIKSKNKGYVMQATEVGWIVSGPLKGNRDELSKPLCMMTEVKEIDESLRKFWELEEINEQRELTSEEKQCIEHFETNIQRNGDGSYTVALPFKRECAELGMSRRMAIAQMLQLEKKFANNEQLKNKYVEYMNELIQRGYLKACTFTDSHDHPKRSFYLPHHPVLKDSTTTKVRPVFDASRKTSNGIALNDNLLTGPRLQDDLCDILMRFRLHRIAFTADIEKMYLHVWLREEDRDLQRIIWRSDPTKPLIDYQLTTVTFGVNSSPFLAVATIQHHAKNAKERYPQASELVLSDLYMDDLSSGCDDLETATQIQKQTTQILADAGFPLRKWMSNNEELMERIPENQKEGSASEDGCISTLGLRWHHSCDKLSFKANTKDSSSKITKRAILSQITAIYDPLGLLAPITIYNKILMQQVWREKTDWDDSVSTEIASKWNAFKQQIGIVEKIKVNRWINCTNDTFFINGISAMANHSISICWK